MPVERPESLFSPRLEQRRQRLQKQRERYWQRVEQKRKLEADQQLAQPQTQPESPTRQSYLEKLRAVSERDGSQFIEKVMGAFDTLLCERLPQVEQSEKSLSQGLESRLAANQGRPDGQYFRIGYERLRMEGHVEGLRDAFEILFERITGEGAKLWGLREEEPKRPRTPRRKK
jgi:hypothetical protein